MKPFVATTLLVATACTISAITACGASKESPAHSATLNVNMGQAPVTLDPATAYDSSSLSVLQNFYLRLTRFAWKPGPDGTRQFDPAHVTGYLAKSWTISNGGKRYTFKLNKAQFNDGTPVDAAAVKYTFERDLTAAGTAAYVLTNGITGLYRSIEAPAADTLVLNLSQPNSDELSDLATSFASIVEPKMVEANGGVKKGVTNKWMSAHIAGGGGPFVLASYTPGVGAVAQRNGGFFGKAAASSTVDLHFVTSDVTLAVQARSGQADVTLGMSKSSAASLKGTAGLRVVSYPTDNTERVGFVTTTPPFDNKTFRAALTYAVDYKGILTKVNEGYGTLMNGPWAPTIPGFDPKLENPRPYSLTQARALLRSSGVKLPVNAQLAVQNDNALEQQIATIVQGEWRPLGVNIQIVKLSPADMVTAVGKRKYPLFIQGNSPAVYSALYDYGYDLACGNAYNTTNLCIKQADQLAKQALSSTSAASKTDLLNQIVRLVNGQAPFVSLYADEAVVVLGSKVKSFAWSSQTDFSSWG